MESSKIWDYPTREELEKINIRSAVVKSTCKRLYINCFVAGIIIAFNLFVTKNVFILGFGYGLLIAAMIDLFYMAYIGTKIERT